MELFSPHHFNMAGLAAEVFWAVGLVMVSTCCCFVQRWHYIQLAISRPMSVTLFMLFIRLMPKSLRWLISRGRSRRARAVAERIASYNGLRLSPGLLLQLEKLCHMSERTRHGVWILGTCFERRR